MFTLVIVLIVFVAVLLVLVVLAQNSKGGGLSGQFGGAGASQLMGVKKTGDLLEKLTWGLAITLMALTLSTKFLITDTTGVEISSPNIESAQEKAMTPDIEELTKPENQNTGTTPPEKQTEENKDVIDQE